MTYFLRKQFKLNINFIQLLVCFFHEIIIKSKTKQNQQKLKKRISQSLIAQNMSSGHFARTARNTPQRNLNKSQQPTEASFTPSQDISVAAQQPNTGGYVYRPPTRIARTNINAVKQLPKVEEKVEMKKEQLSKKIEINKIEQPPVQKPGTFVRKPVTEVVKQTTTVKTTTIVSQVTEVKEQVKPIIVKPVSRLTANRTSDPLAMLGLAPPKKQQSHKVQQTPKPATLPYYKTKPIIEQKPQVKPLSTTIPKNPLQQLTHDSTNTKSVPTLQMKKPSSFHSYPKKISKRDHQLQIQTEQVKKPQTVTSFEQVKPQTPKFNREPVEQFPQPQAFSSTYSYRNKNVNNQVSSNQSSQSSTNLKQPAYQSNIPSNVERITQSQKPPTSVVLESPIKSPMSHASRYSNKIETPKVTQSKQQASFKALVKRSPLLGFALHRLYTQKFTSHLQQFIQYSKNIKQTKANERLHQYFERSLSKFIKNFEQNVLARNSFGLIKSIYSKTVKADMMKSTDPKVANQLVANRNQCVGKVLQNIIPSDLKATKSAFLKLKSNLIETRTHQTKIEQGTKILCGLEFKRLKQNWQLLCEWTNVKSQVKTWKLNRCLDINNSYRKWLLKDSFAKLTLNKLKELIAEVKTSSQTIKQLSKSANIKTPQQTVTEPEQFQANKQLKQKLSDLQKKLSQAQQKSSQIPKQRDLRNNLQELKSQKQQVSQQLSVKKQRNSELTQRLQTLISKVSHQQLSSLSQTKPQNQEPTLSLIHQIYMKSYKQPQQQCVSEQNLSSLYSIHRVEENSSMREIVAKWLAVNENMNLKHWINLYEGNYVSDASGSQLLTHRKEVYKQLQEENEIVKKFIRSYIKERYMWEQVKEYVAAVISQ